MRSGTTPQGEPRLVIPALAPFYDWARGISWLIIRLTAGGILLVHGIVKVTGPGVTAFAASSMARRGIEPALFFAYVIFFNETVGAVCLMLGLFTRVIAAMIAVEFFVVTFFAHFKNGFAFTSPGGGPWSLDRKLGREI